MDQQQNTIHHHDYVISEVSIGSGAGSGGVRGVCARDPNAPGSCGEAAEARSHLHAAKKHETSCACLMVYRAWLAEPGTLGML